MRKMVLFLIMGIVSVGFTACEKRETEEPTEEVYSTEETESPSTETKEISIDDYDYSNYVTLGEYKNLEIPVCSTSVTDLEVEASLEGLRRNNVIYKPSTKEEVEVNDWVNISFNSTVDGAVVEEYTANDAEIEVGKATIFEEVDTALIGMKVGETKEICVTLSDDWHDEALAGKEMNMSFTLNSIDEESLPEVTDAWIQEMAAFSTVEDWKENEFKNLEAAKQEQQQVEFETGIIERITANTEFKELPVELVEFLISEYKKEDVSYAESLGLELEAFITDYYGYGSLEQYEADLREYVEANVKNEFLFKALQDKENIEVSSDYYNSFIEECVEYYEFSSAEELVEYYGEDVLKAACLNDKTYEVLCSLNTMVPEDSVEE